MILLDTHILLWWLDKPEQLPLRYKTILDTTEEIAISAITCWEISMLVGKNRVKLPDPYSVWIRNAITKSRIVLLPLSLEVIDEVYNLPEEFHADPADRIIAATSITYGAQLAIDQA